MDVTSVLDQLNTAQEQAVTSDKKHLLVLAGAGSGKTRVLVHRIAWKIQVDNVSPYGILAVTFTNKAAREMRERIDNSIRYVIARYVGGHFPWFGSSPS
jgi:DNA helicase-2/ATP-dependent DNA helicase PcrA